MPPKGFIEKDRIMGKYRKKSVVIEAIQWTGGLECQEAIRSLGKVTFIGIPPHAVSIETLEGTMTATFQDFIIKDVKGELSLCKPDIFAETYEKVQD